MNDLKALFPKILLLCGILLTASVAHAEKRFALVIGNDAYSTLPILKKAVNDARAVSQVVKKIGFEVLSGENLTRRDFNNLIADFEDRLSPGDQAFFFFAGHGIAIGAENYLIPTDIPESMPAREAVVAGDAIALNDLIERIRDRDVRYSFFVVDACRDNPFKAAGTRSVGAERGLTRPNESRGVFVLYSAGIGQSALDRVSNADSDKNSVFTRKLIPLLETPGLTHVQIAKKVQSEVALLSMSVFHDQQPAYYDQILGEVVLNQNKIEDQSKEFRSNDVNRGEELASLPPAVFSRRNLSRLERRLLIDTDLTDVAIGNADAPVTIIEYASMTCPHCASFHENTLPAIKEKYIDTGKVRLIFRHFPFDSRAAAAAMISRCASSEFHFPLVDMMFQQQGTWVRAEDPRPPLLQIARLAGFTQESFEACLKNQAMLDKLLAVREKAAKEFKVESTPTFFINGEKHAGALPVEEMSKIIDKFL